MLDQETKRCCQERVIVIFDKPVSEGLKESLYQKFQRLKNVMSITNTN